MSQTAQEIFTRTRIYNDGTVSVDNVTAEVIQMRNDLRRPSEETQQTMTIKEVAEMFGYEINTVYCKISSGFFVEGKHYKRINAKKVLFYKKELLKMLGMR